jgi:hypothetical protein
MSALYLVLVILQSAVSRSELPLTALARFRVASSGYFSGTNQDHCATAHCSLLTVTATRRVDAHRTRSLGVAG